MIIKKLFDARSAIWQLAFALIFVGYFSHLAERTVMSPRGGFTYDGGPVDAVFSIGFLILATWAYISVRRHNRKHPDSKVSMFQLYPPEILDGDEMFQGATKNAAKRVYLYNNYALPLLVILTLFYLKLPLGVGTVFAIYLVGYYLTYLRAIWPFLGED